MWDSGQIESSLPRNEIKDCITIIIKHEASIH